MDKMKAVTQCDILITSIADHFNFHHYPSIRCSIDLTQWFMINIRAMTCDLSKSMGIYQTSELEGFKLRTTRVYTDEMMNSDENWNWLKFTQINDENITIARGNALILQFAFDAIILHVWLIYLLYSAILNLCKFIATNWLNCHVIYM